MKSVSTALANHLAGPVTTLATCWAITRADGVEFFFTDHDADIVFDGNTYLAKFGYSRTAMVSDSKLSVDNLEVDGFFDDVSITEQDMRAGLFDYAEVRIFLINWADTSMGIMRMRRGWLGEVVITDKGIFRTELRGLTQVLQQNIGEVYTPECRADLGDSRCKVDLSALERTGTITGVTSRQVFAATISGAATPANWFDGGVLEWTTGANAGRSVEVKTEASGTFTIYLAVSYPIEVGDEFEIVPGCDKRFETCKAKYNNAINFRGEPYVPGQDSILSYPDAV